MRYLYRWRHKNLHQQLLLPLLLLSQVIIITCSCSHTHKSNYSPTLSLLIYFIVSSQIIDNMDLNIAHAHLSHLRVIFTSAFAIQALDYVTDHTDVLQSPLLTFFTKNRTNRFIFQKKVDHWHLWGGKCHFGFWSIFCLFCLINWPIFLKIMWFFPD